MRPLLLAILLVQCAAAQVEFQLFVTGPANVPGTVIPGLPAAIVAYFNNAPVPLPDMMTVEIGGQAASILSAPGYSLTVAVPANLPPGAAQLFIAENGGGGVTNVNVVKFLVLTHSGGIGQALAQNVVAGVVETNNLTHPAHPGDTVTLYGVGIPSATQFGVLLGGHPATVTYGGPAPSLPGIDQINFQVPANVAIPNGCFVAVQVVVNGVASNPASISKAPAGATACTPPIDLTVAQMAQLDAGQSIPYVHFSIDGLVSAPPGLQTIESLATGPLLVRNESFNVEAILTNEASLAAMSQPLLAEDVFYSCTASSGAPAAIAVLDGGNSIDLGPKLTLTGPGTTGYLLTSPSGLESLSLPTGPPVSSPDQLPPPYFVSGVWQITGPGSQPNPYFQSQYPTLPFQAQITTPPTIQITNYASLQTIDVANGLVVAWNPAGYGPGDVVNVTIGPAGASCRAHATDGQLSIPSSLLPIVINSQVGAATSQGPYLQISAVPRPDQIVRADIPLSGGGFVPGTFTYSFTESFPIFLPVYGVFQ